MIQLRSQCRSVCMLSLLFGLGMAGAVHAAPLAELETGSSYVTASQVGQGYSGGMIPWSLINPRNPATNYMGPSYYGGAQGSTAIGAGAFLFANSTPDYITVQAAAGAAGDWVTLAPMFVLAEASVLSNVTFSPRLTGSALQQTNYTRIVIRQNGGLYLSDTNWYFNSNSQNFNESAINAMSWYTYDPTNNMRGNEASLAPGVKPTNITAVGVLLYNENTVARSAAIGLSEFLAWGETALINTNVPVGDFTMEVVSAYGLPDPAVGVHTNAGGTIVTNTAGGPGPVGGTQLVVSGWAMTGHAPVFGATANFTMTVTNNAVLTWLWETNVLFTRAAGTGGSIDGNADGYYSMGSSVTVTGIPAGGYDFAGWSGDVPPGQTNDNPLLLTLDRTRSIVAGFVTNGAPAGPLQLPSLSNKPAAARFVLSTNRVWPAVAGEPDVCLWDGDRFAAYSITIDDNHAWDHSWWEERSAETGFKFTWFVISGRVEKDGSTWAGFQALQDAGHSVQSHTQSHLIDITNGWPGIDWDYRAAQTNIRENISGTKVLALSYPGGYQNPTLPYSTNNDRVVAAEYYYAARGAVGTPNKANMIDYFNTASVGIGTGRAYSDALLYGTSSIAWLNNSQYLRGWQCTHFHNVTNIAAMAPVWAADMAYLATLTNDLWVGLFDEVVRYGQERDTSTLSVLTNDERATRFLLSDDMLDSRFDYPLTVKVRLYESWTNPVALQAGTPVTLTEVSTNGARFALIRVVPDRGEVILQDRSTDYDEDGAADWEEIFTGSDPDDPESYPELYTQLDGTTGKRVFWWSSVPPLTYSIRASSNLMDGFTTPLLTNIPATPPLNTVTVDAPPEVSVFYHLIAE